MKKLTYLFIVLFSIGTVLTGCRDKRNAGDKIENGMEQVGEGMEDAAEQTGEAVEDAAEATGDAVENAAEEVDQEVHEELND